MLILAPFHFVEMFAEAEATPWGHARLAVATRGSQAPVQGPGVRFPWTLVLAPDPRAGCLPQRAAGRRGPGRGRPPSETGLGLRVVGCFALRAPAWAPGSARAWTATGR